MCCIGAPERQPNIVRVRVCVCVFRLVGLRENVNLARTAHICKCARAPGRPGVVLSRRVCKTRCAVDCASFGCACIASQSRSRGAAELKPIQPNTAARPRQRRAHVRMCGCATERRRSRQQQPLSLPVIYCHESRPLSAPRNVCTQCRTHTQTTHATAGGCELAHSGRV